MSLALAVLAAVLFGIGTWLTLQRTLTRIVLGLAVIGHGTVLLILLVGGRAGPAPFAGEADPSSFADPLPQALALTAIVITFGVSAFLLALDYRSWQLEHHDEVEDDLEDQRIAAERAHDVDARFDERDFDTEFPEDDVMPGDRAS